MLQCDIKTGVKRAQARRTHLLDIADRLFTERGFHGTGVAQIAAESGVKVGQIYRDFANKEDIIVALAERNVSEWLQEEVLAAAVAAGDVTAIRAWISRFQGEETNPGNDHLISEIVAEACRNDRIATVHRQIDDRVRANLRLALDALVSRKCDAAKLDLLIEFILTMGFGSVARKALRPQAPALALGDLVNKMIDDCLLHL